MTFNPRDISKQSRLQSDIEHGLEEASRLEDIIKERPLTSEELVNLTLCYLEASNWDKVKLYAEQVLVLNPPTEDSFTNNEHCVTALHALNIIKRENTPSQQDLDRLVIGTSMLINPTHSDWLNVCLFRNIALIYLQSSDLKKIGLQQAENSLQSAIARCAIEEAALRLNLLSLMAHCTVSIAFLKNEAPIRGINLFKEVSQGYHQFFTEKKIDWRDSHDYALYRSYQDKMLNKIYEKELFAIDRSSLSALVELLIETLAFHEKNPIDNIIAGDTCFWLGQVYKNMGNNQEARFFYEKALTYHEGNLQKTRQISCFLKELADSVSAAHLGSLSITPRVKDDTGPSTNPNSNFDTLTQLRISVGTNS